MTLLYSHPIPPPDRGPSLRPTPDMGLHSTGTPPLVLRSGGY